MVEQADLLIGYHTYPHVDQRAHGRQAGLALARLLDRTIHPTPILVKPAMLPTSQRMTTDRPPMRTLMQHAEEWERHPRVVDVTIAGGFPPADVPEAGLSVLVTTDDDPALAAKVAEELAALAWDLRHGFLGGVATWEEAAEAIRHTERGPLVLVDIADNPWTGGPGDSVELLRFLLKEQARPAALALVRDPEVVDECFRAGIGATVEVELGGKTDDLHGPPLPVRGTIRLLSDGRYVNAGPMHAGVTVDLGRTVVLRVEGIDVLVTERARVTDRFERLPLARNRADRATRHRAQREGTFPRGLRADRRTSRPRRRTRHHGERSASATVPLHPPADLAARRGVSDHPHA
jgi:microcystin degradation protein MlrC